MARWFLLMTTVALLTASSAQASVGQLTISVDGGIGVPIGNFASEEAADAGLGFRFGGGVEYQVTPVFAVGLDGSYNRNSHSIEGTTESDGETGASFDKDRFGTWHLGFHGTYLFPVTGETVQPFLRLGLGIYSMSESWEYTYTDPVGVMVDSGKETFGSRLGGSLGAGANFRITDTIGFGVGAEYTYISMDENKFYGSSASYLGFRGSLNYSIM